MARQAALLTLHDRYPNMCRAAYMWLESFTRDNPGATLQDIWDNLPRGEWLLWSLWHGENFYNMRQHVRYPDIAFDLLQLPYCDGENFVNWFYDHRGINLLDKQEMGYRNFRDTWQFTERPFLHTVSNFYEFPASDNLYAICAFQLGLIEPTSDERPPRLIEFQYASANVVRKHLSTSYL